MSDDKHVLLTFKHKNKLVFAHSHCEELNKLVSLLFEGKLCESQVLYVAYKLKKENDKVTVDNSYPYLDVNEKKSNDLVTDLNEKIFDCIKNQNLSIAEILFDGTTDKYTTGTIHISQGKPTRPLAIFDSGDSETDSHDGKVIHLHARYLVSTDGMPFHIRNGKVTHRIIRKMRMEKLITEYFNKIIDSNEPILPAKIEYDLFQAGVDCNIYIPTEGSVKLTKPDIFTIS